MNRIVDMTTTDPITLEVVRNKEHVEENAVGEPEVSYMFSELLELVLVRDGYYQ